MVLFMLLTVHFDIGICVFLYVVILMIVGIQFSIVTLLPFLLT